jgi:hypothetical protein
MRRAAVRPIHLLRVAIYSSDIAVWLGLIWLIVFAMDVLADQRWLPLKIRQVPSGVQETMLGWSLVVLALCLTWRLSAGIGNYLRFRHAIAMAISVQVILLLVTLKILVILYVQ